MAYRRSGSRRSSYRRSGAARSGGSRRMRNAYSGGGGRRGASPRQTVRIEIVQPPAGNFSSAGNPGAGIVPVLTDGKLTGFQQPAKPGKAKF